MFVFRDTDLWGWRVAGIKVGCWNRIIWVPPDPAVSLLLFLPSSCPLFWIMAGWWDREEKDNNHKMKRKQLHKGQYWKEGYE